MAYISHARTPEALKDEVCSHIRMRIASLDAQIKASNSASEKAKLGAITMELEQMFAYWSELVINRPRKSHQPAQAETAQDI
jgi:hypothetical protein